MCQTGPVNDGLPQRSEELQTGMVARGLLEAASKLTEEKMERAAKQAGTCDRESCLGCPLDKSGKGLVVIMVSSSSIEELEKELGLNRLQ